MNEIIEPTYFLITAIAFAILSIIQYKKVGKTLETIYLSILFIFFLISYFILIFGEWSYPHHSQVNAKNIKKQLKSDTNKYFS